MTKLTLADVIEGLTGHRPVAPQPIQGVVIDSRQAKAGSLFVALPGDKQDGHAFVGQAFQSGAIAAITHHALANIAEGRVIQKGQPGPAELSESDLPICIQVEDSLKGLQALATFWRNRFTPRVIGITGSVGKSTTKELVAAVLATRFQTLKNEGNLNNEIVLPLTLLNLTAAHERVVLEMGMYEVGEIALLCQIARPQVGVVTNVGPTHLKRLGTMERIVQAKTELVQALPPMSTLGEAGGVAILNRDDPLVMSMVSHTTAQVLTYGLSPEADLWADDVVSMGLEGVRFVLHYKGEATHLKIPLLGQHSVHTALRAALVGLVEGLDWEDIVNGLQALPKAAQLRLVAISGPNDSILLDDTYNASPTSTIAALNLLDDLTGAKKIAVLGDMLELGNYEEEGHRKVGCRAASVVDLLIVVGTPARFIAVEARACGLAPACVLEMPDKESIIAHLTAILESDDIVLIKGSNAQRLDKIVSALMEQRDKEVVSRAGKA